MFLALRLLAIFAVVSLPFVRGQTPTLTFTFGALSLSPGSEGGFHLRTGESTSTPVQMSTRYFCEPVTAAVTSIELYAQPLGKELKGAPPAAPLLRLPLDTSSTGSFHVVIWNDTSQGKERLAGKVFAAEKWPAGRMLLLNASAVPIAIEAGTVRQVLKAGASFAFPASEAGQSLPVKMYLQDGAPPGKAKLVFSSAWRIEGDRRELCVIYPNPASRSVSVRSLMERASLPKPTP